MTPVSEVSEPLEYPSLYLDFSAEAAVGVTGVQAEDNEEEMGEAEEMEEPPAAVPFSRLFTCADRSDWALMIVGSIAAAAHRTALVVYLHYFAKIIEAMRSGTSSSSEERYDRLLNVKVSCWILTGERQTAIIRSKYVQVLLNQDLSFFDTYGNNRDIVSQVLSDVLLIQSALIEKITLITLAMGPFIVAVGGISNIFLHRLAKNIQDAYDDAASIAEQIWRKEDRTESLEWRWESIPHRKVDILGATGGIGQPLSLLMKLNPLISNLALYDISNTLGVAADVSHINTRSEVS
ncbi:ABC transporter B family member 20 [Linum perenne]